MKTDLKVTIKRALIFSAPFLLISAAVILFTVWAMDTFVENNLYFQISTLAPKMSEDKGTKNIPYIEYTPEEKEDIQEQNEDLFGEDVPPITLGEVWAHITIDSAQVYDQPVYHGDYADLLMKGIGHYSNSRFPGQHGKVVLAGHVGIKRHFQRLETMHVGDLVTLDTVYGTYVYRVTDTYIFDAEDPALKSLLLPDEEDTGDRLIAYTCYPYHTTRVRTQRFVIDCELISGYDYVTQELVGETEE